MSSSQKSGDNQSSNLPPIDSVTSRSWDWLLENDVEEWGVCECELGVATVDDDLVASRAVSMRARRSGGVPGCAGYAISPQPGVWH